MSFRLKIIAGVALIEAVLLGLLIATGVQFLSETADAAFAQRAEATVRAFALAARQPLAASDANGIEASAQKMLSYPGVVFARVRAAGGTLLATAGDGAPLAFPPRQDRSLDTVTDGVFHAARTVTAGTDPQSQVLGQVELGLEARSVQSLHARTVHFAVLLGAGALALAALFSWVLGSYLTRQLASLRDASREIAGGNFGHLVAVHGQDELALTAQAFNRMSERLRDSYRELAERETNHRRILDSIQDGILTLTTDGTIAAASTRAATILARPQAALPGLPVATLLDKRSASTMQAALAAAGHTPTPSVELRVLTPAGGLVTVEAQLSPLAEQEPPSVLMVFRDITVRVQIREELRLRGRIIDQAGIGVVIADTRRADLPVCFVNPTFSQITGYGAEEMLGQDCANFLQRTSLPQPEVERICHALRAGHEDRALLRNIAKSGKQFWNDLQVVPIRNEDGQLTHCAGLLTDVSERIAAQHEIAQRQSHLQRVLDSTHDGIVVIDRHGTVESYNRGAERMLGWPTSEIAGRNLAELARHFVLSDASARSAHELRVFLSNEDGGDADFEREFDTQRRDGSQVWIELRVRRMQGGAQRRFLCVLHDITERKLAEIELKGAKEAAEEATNAKTDFLANMSHEIRTPMHGVLGSLEMLVETPLTGQQQRFLDTARNSATVLLGVIDEILDFSRIEAGKLRIEALDFDLRRTVEDVTAMLAPRAYTKHLELACFIAPETPEIVHGDPVRLRQILINLLGNAIKFTERGEVVVTVTQAAGNVPSGSLRFEVRDTGIGIPAGKQAILFEPFTQAASSTSRRYGGSGLGLSITRRLVELMDGTIAFESMEGRGSRFWFTLPLAPVEVSAQPPRPLSLAGTRVLLVDDNATNRIILHRYLSSWSAQSSSAAGGVEALAKLQDAAHSGQPYDLALLDLHLPDLDGYALAQAIRADPLLAGTPLIMLSSSGQEPERMQGLKIDVWLDKPLRQSDLHDAIATVLRRRAPARQPPVQTTRVSVDFAGERVLLVEDNPTSRDIGVHMLRRYGLTVDVAETGEEALAAVQTNPYDLVLMDIQMPGMDGYTATRAIRSWESGSGSRRMPIIALTAHALPADRERCLASGMDDYVVKPYTAATITTAVARWLMPPGRTNSEEDAADVLDHGHLREVRQFMGTDFAALLDKAAYSLSERLAQLQQRLADGDRAGARDAVHALKNTAGDVGAQHLRTLATEAERALGSGTIGSQQVALLAQALQRVVQALAELETK